MFSNCEQESSLDADLSRSALRAEIQWLLPVAIACSWPGLDTQVLNNCSSSSEFAEMETMSHVLNKVSTMVPAYYCTD